MTMTSAKGLRALAAAAALLGSAHAASAQQGMPNSTQMTCAQALALVTSRGAVVLATGGRTYDRYVRDRGFCWPTQDTKPEWVPTRDKPQCFVGYTCFDPARDNDRH